VSSAFVDGIGLIAPGLPSWRDAQPVLRGTTAYVPAPVGAVQPDILPANERRRAPLGVRLALRAAQDATAESTLAPATLASVFASSDADIEIIHRICCALAEPVCAVSPTDFHNSVHNAASGYWSIGTAARGASSAVSAYDFNLATGLRETLALLRCDDTDALLVLYDVPPPPPLYAKRPVAHPAAMALLLTRGRTSRTIAHLALCDATGEDMMEDEGLEELRRANPAARALPLLAAIAAQRSAVIGVRQYDDRCIGIRVETL
jgi:Beta-ketoacyl synthase, N-terminal domain